MDIYLGWTFFAKSFSCFCTHDQITVGPVEFSSTAGISRQLFHSKRPDCRMFLLLLFVDRTAVTSSCKKTTTTATRLLRRTTFQRRDDFFATSAGFWETSCERIWFCWFYRLVLLFRVTLPSLMKWRDLKDTILKIGSQSCLIWDLSKSHIDRKLGRQ